MKWQERYALWILRPRWGQKWNDRISKWWVFTLFGLALSIPIFWCSTLIYTGHQSSTRIEEIKKESLTPEERSQKIESEWYSVNNKLKIQGSLLRSIFIAGGFGVILAYVVIGLIWEERRGYQIIIAKLKKENLKTEPGAVVNASDAAGKSENHLHD